MPAHQLTLFLHAQANASLYGGAQSLMAVHGKPVAPGTEEPHSVSLQVRATASLHVMFHCHRVDALLLGVHCDGIGIR